MAGGWSRDGAIQDQIDDSIKDAIKQARSQLPQGESLSHCEECDKEIPQGRREAIPGVHLCVVCQEIMDTSNKTTGVLNRRGSKNSQLR